ncbi:sulfatase [Maribacter stanieri]|uniref:sulfatase n=1 Tax=Maribacter stanieri TaxID=440514 RepID=UPI0024956046|nr:sulfatase [Maribacter stanieri]|tara:strand:+ start:107 stop:1549 length:1443 start_codon:yes stop_codon:yes gene_type:complete
MSKYVMAAFIFWVYGGAMSFAQDKNVLIIFIDDLRPELNSFGANYIHSPNIDSINARGRGFSRHYVNAPSCGPSRYAFLTGQYGLEYRGESNQSLFKRAEGVNDENVSIAPSMPEWFRNNGYTTVSVGKVSHHPGGRGGDNWDDSNISEMPNAWDKHIMPVAEWESPKGAMHGLANGKVRTPDNRDIIEAVDGNDKSYPDGHIAEEGLRQIDALVKGDKPFFLAIGLIKPHLPFGVPKKYFDLYENVEIPPALHPEKPKGRTTWHGSGEFMNYNRWGKDPRNDKDFALKLKKYYAACVSYADKHVGDIIQKLKETGADKNTIVVLWGDHGWHLGEHSIWGKHSLFEESLRSPLIIYDPTMQNRGEMSDAIVESVDVFPTLCDMTSLSIPSFTEGISLKPLIENPDTTGHEAVAYISNATTIRTDQYRFTQHKDGAVELYDHQNPLGEQLNIAEHNPKIVQELRTLLLSKTADKAFIYSNK